MNKSLVQQQFGANAANYVGSTVHAKGASLAGLVEAVQPEAHWSCIDVATGAGHTAIAFAPTSHTCSRRISPRRCSTRSAAK